MPRHPPCALSSLTYINFHTRFEVPPRCYVPYSVFNVLGPLSLPCTAGSLRSPALTADLSNRCRRIASRGPNVACLRLSVATGSGQRNRPDVCRPIGGLSSGTIRLFDCADRVPHQCSYRCSFASLSVLSVAVAVYCCRPVAASGDGWWSRGGLELLTSALQRRCSPN